MKMKDKSIPAFPSENKFYINGQLDEAYYYAGMTLRDYFAAKAMQGLLASTVNANNGVWLGKDHPNNTRDLSVVSYIIADEMLKEREK
jgi:hypothetical protein